MQFLFNFFHKFNACRHTNVHQDLSSASSKSSNQDNDNQDTSINDKDMNFVSNDISSSQFAESKTDELNAIHELGKMGFSMEVVLQAIDEVKSTDAQTLLDHILFKGILKTLSIESYI